MDAEKMAKEAASLHIYGMENDGEAIPKPSQSLPQKNMDGNVIMPITIYSELYRAKRDKE